MTHALYINNLTSKFSTFQCLSQFDFPLPFFSKPSLVSNTKPYLNSKNKIYSPLKKLYCTNKCNKFFRRISQVCCSSNRTFIPKKFNEALSEARKSALYLSNFRKHVRIELPFPIPPTYDAIDTRIAIIELTEEFSQIFIQTHGLEKVYVSLPDASMRIYANTSNRSVEKRELNRLKTIRPKIWIITCPRAEEAALFNHVAKVIGNDCIIIIINALWKKHEFGRNRKAPYEAWNEFASFFEETSSIAFWFEEYCFQRSIFEKLFKNCAKFAIYKKYGSKWDLFLANEREYLFCTSKNYKPSISELRKISLIYLPVQLPSIQFREIFQKKILCEESSIYSWFEEKENI